MSDEEVVDSGVEQEVQSPVEAAPEAPAEAPAPQSDPGVWGAFKSLPQFAGKEDREIARTLYTALERERQASHALSQYRQVLPIAQEYLANRSEFDKWRASLQRQPQQAPEPQQAKQPEGWWNPPQVREAYKQYLVKDENGRDFIHPDAPLDARHSLTELLQYKANFAQKFLTNPEDALGPMVQKLAQQQAQEIVQQQFAERAENEFVSRLERENADWLYDQQTGNVSREGALVQKYIEEAKQLGIGSPDQRWRYALNNTERDLMLEAQTIQEQRAARSQFDESLRPAPVQEAPPAAPTPARTQAESNMDYLRRAASRAPSRAGVTSNNPQAATRGMSFEERLKHTLNESGFA
jgi:hypothetical protein